MHIAQGCIFSFSFLSPLFFTSLFCLSPLLSRLGFLFVCVCSFARLQQFTSKPQIHFSSDLLELIWDVVLQRRSLTRYIVSHPVMNQKNTHFDLGNFNQISLLPSDKPTNI